MFLKYIFLGIAIFVTMALILGVELPNLEKKAKKEKKPLLQIKKAVELKNKIADLLVTTNSKMTLKQYIQLSLLLAFLGAVVGIVYSNILISIVLAAGFPFLMYQILLKKSHDAIRSRNEKLELYMSIVTNSYIQSNDIVQAIFENYIKMDQNEAASKPFGYFVGQAARTTDITQCILDMKKDVDNEHFKAWCDKLALCRENSALKQALPYVMTRMQKRRTLDRGAVEGCHKHYKEFLFMCGLSILAVFSAPYLDETWRFILTKLLFGKILFAGVLVVIFLSIAYVVKANSLIGGDKR